MPVATPLDIAVLSSPVPIPGETGTIPGTSGTLDMEQQVNFGDVSNALTKGSGVVPPIGSGNKTQIVEEKPPPPSQVSSGTFKASDLDATGANVGGLAKEAGTPEDTKMELEFTTASAQKEAEDAEKAQENFDAQVDEYKKAYEEGLISTIDTRKDSTLAGAAIGSYLAPGIGTAIGAGIGYLTGKKKGDEVGDGMQAARFVKRQDRRADRKARKEAGLTGKKKRLARRAQRRQRRDAYKEFKDYLKSEAEIQAANLET